MRFADVNRKVIHFINAEAYRSNLRKHAMSPGKKTCQALSWLTHSRPRLSTNPTPKIATHGAKAGEGDGRKYVSAEGEIGDFISFALFMPHSAIQQMPTQCPSRRLKPGKCEESSAML